MAVVRIKMSQAVIEKSAQLEASSSGTSTGLAGFVDQVISTSQMLGDAFSYANSYTSSSNKVTFNFGQNRTVVYTGTISGGGTYSGTATATSKVLTVPSVIKEDISGTIYYNWNVDPSSGYLTFSPYGTATVNSYKIQTLDSSSSEDFGKVSIGLQGSMLLDSETESLSGSISKLTIGAEKFLSSTVIEGNFNVSGVLTSTEENVNSAISGTLSSYKENYKDGSYIDVVGSLDYDGTTSIDRAMLADEANWSGDDTFDINLPTSLSQSWVISSGDGSDTITASGGNSYLTLAGGAGNDIYIVNNISYTILENFGDGTDTIQSSGTYSLGSLENLENLTLTGTGNISGTGNALDNIITGNGGANILNGADGDDTLNGGAGNDTLIGGLGVNDLRGDAGNDTFIVDYTSFSDGDTGMYNTITDSAGVDKLTATFGYIDPSNGAYGESDTNTYVNVRRTGVNGNDLSVGIRNGTGLDGLYDWWGKTTVQGQYSYGSSYANIIDSFSLSIVGESFPATVNLALATGSNQTRLNGTAGADLLMGFGGSSVINGNAGSDILLGSRFDTPEELAVYNAINDTSITVDNVQEASRLGIIVGDRIFGGADNDYLNGYLGNDYLDGGAGADQMIGWEGDDTYVVDNLGDTIQEAYTGGSFSDAGGIDLVMASINYTLGDYLENLTLTGTGNIRGTGNALDNVITGNSGNNTLIGGLGDDIIYGGAGNDYMEHVDEDGAPGNDTYYGGLGNDIYVVDAAGATIVEYSNQGIDSVYTQMTSFTLSDHIENLYYDKDDAEDFAGTGNGAANMIRSMGGNDTLDGGAGADTLIGGAGDDIYYVDNTGDVVTELSANNTLSQELFSMGNNNDVIVASVSYTLSDKTTGIEDLMAAGDFTTGADTDNAINLTGNKLAQALIGNDAINVLNGLAGDDILVGFGGADTLNGGDGNDGLLGGAGNDSMSGGRGNDIFVFNFAAQSGTNLIGETSDAVYVTGGSDTADGGEGIDILFMQGSLDNYSISRIGLTQYRITTNVGNFVSSDEQITFQNIERLKFGSILDDIGSDSGFVDLSSINIVSSFNDTIRGTSGNDTLDGDAGADTLIGGLGDDVYIVDNIGDKTTEVAAQGTDTIRSSITWTALAANVENLTLTGTGNINGTGNTLNNIITGNSGNNILNGGAGNDTIDGGDGADTINGDAGDDILSANAGGGTINGGVGNDTLYGGTGTDILDGGAGNDVLYNSGSGDTLTGGAGNDTYYIDSSPTTLRESANGGIDSIITTISFDLQWIANHENLTLTGSGPLFGIGNSLANTIIGNDGDNTINGGLGNDTLTGGLGNDIFVFNTAPNRTSNVDRITDFSLTDDTIQLENAVFTGLGSGTGTLDSSMFRSGAGVTTAGDSSDRIIYNTTSGALFYDADGTGVTAAVQIALIGNQANLTVNDLVII